MRPKELDIFVVNDLFCLGLILFDLGGRSRLSIYNCVLEITKQYTVVYFPKALIWALISHFSKKMPKWQKYVRKATISRSCMASNSIRGSLAATMATISKLCSKIMRPFFHSNKWNIIQNAYECIFVVRIGKN